MFPFLFLVIPFKIKMPKSWYQMDYSYGYIRVYVKCSCPLYVSLIDFTWIQMKIPSDSRRIMRQQHFNWESSARGEKKEFVSLPGVKLLTISVEDMQKPQPSNGRNNYFFKFSILIYYLILHLRSLSMNGFYDPLLNNTLIITNIPSYYFYANPFSNSLVTNLTFSAVEKRI